MKKNSYTHRIAWDTEMIVISNAFATAAQKVNSPAYKQLMDLRKAYPGFGIQVHKAHISPAKQKYKGLGFDEMRRCIIEWDGEGSANLAVLNKARTDKVPYPKVKKWFLGIYGNHYKHYNYYHRDHNYCRMGLRLYPLFSFLSCHASS